MRIRWAGLALSVVALAGCGGGGGGSSPPYMPTTTPPPVATPSPSPTPIPSPTPSSAAAPTLGYLAGSGTTFSGTTSSAAKSVTLAAISEKLIPLPVSPVFLPTSIQVDVSGASQTRVRRSIDLLSNSSPPSAPRVSLSAERLVNATSLQGLESRLRRASSATVSASATSAPTPASSRTFAILSGGIGPSATSYVNVGATLQQTTSHGYVYIDNSLGLSTSVISAIASDFENAYLSDTTHFGTSDYPSNAPFGPLNGTAIPCDSSGNKIAGASPIPVTIPDSDGHTYVVVVSQANAGNGEGGYFDPANYFIQSFANCFHKTSNLAPMIVLVWPTIGNQQPVFETQEDMVRVSAHEFQHLINFVNHCILAPVCSGTGMDEPWLNEGLSMLAQDLAVHQLYPNVAYDVDEALSYAVPFLQNPQSFNIGSFAGIDAGSSSPAFNCNGCYGGAYLLQRYFYNRFGGDSYTRAMETGTGTSGTNLSNVSGGTPYGTLLGDFSVALMAAQSGVSATTPFTFALNPGGTFTDQFGAPTTLPTIGLAGTNTLGSSFAYTSCQGCLFFVSIPTNGTAASLKVTDVTSTASLAAGVLQR